jgi:exopolysaccharide production protein ExoQ
MLTFLIYLVPSLVTVGLAIAVALTGFLQYRLASKLAPDMRLVCVLLVVGAGALLSVLFTSRTLNETQLSAGMMVIQEDLAGGFAASRWLSLFLVSACAVELLRGWVSNHLSSQRDPALPLLLSMLLFYFGTLAIQASLSEHPDFSLRNFYIPLVLAAVYYQRPLNLYRVFLSAKWVILAVTLGSLIAVFVRPEFVLNSPVPSWIPGVNWRLFGLTPHANALGPIALVALVIEFHQPFESRVLRWLNLSVSLMVLLLAQSKTAWVAALVILAVVWVPLALRRAFTTTAPLRRFNQVVWSTWAVIVLLLVFAAALVAFDVTEKLLSKTDVLTLTGRTEIWDITLRAWKENVLFGFGPQVWGTQRQLRFQMFHVGHAHNQLIQSLGEAGVVGLLLLLIYVGVLFSVAFRRFVKSRGVVLTLLLLLVVRCVTEAPLSRGSLLSWDVFLHGLLMITACHHLRAESSSSQVDSGRPWHPAWSAAAMRVKTHRLAKSRALRFSNDGWSMFGSEPHKRTTR